MYRYILSLGFKNVYFLIDWYI